MFGFYTAIRFTRGRMFGIDLHKKGVIHIWYFKRLIFSNVKGLPFLREA
jgi:hypothetical protein